ncbi:SAM-dependent methyltransferase [Janibacter alittae]|uniref:SAM-dependent methyltransferase n=1 Tax=Janibacter alittae TaxID=3115209 RepID=A0ABZ2MFP5_9MICO
MRTWQEAWAEALYGEGGFYRRAEGPAGHFATATHGPDGELLADALLRLVEKEGLRTVVDVGCGRGELLTALAAVSRHTHPDLDLLGVDVVDRPADLDPRIGWLVAPGGPELPDLGTPTEALVLAHEWLDVVPCGITRADEAGTLRTVHVDEDGAEHLGEPLDEADSGWVGRWWPGPHPPGAVVEIGRARDEAFERLVARTGSGLVVAVDYGHRAGRRPIDGTLMGYRDGSACPPLPDGSCDLTAHVAMDSLRADLVRTQREMLRGLGVDGARPPLDRAHSDPAGYLAALSRASHAAALTGPGPGDFLWAIRRVDRITGSAARSSPRGRIAGPAPRGGSRR